MNKLLKYLLAGLAVVSIGIASTQADNITLYDGLDESYSNTNVFLNPLYNQSSDDIYLLCIGNESSSTLTTWYNAHEIKLRRNDGDYPDFCMGLTNEIESVSVIVNGSQNYGVYNVSYMKTSNFTSLNCQTEYNLIPISEVTANYCRLNFDLIDPAECPINSGTGAIVRSNLTINDTPYAQNQNINVFIPDFLAWNISFNDFTTAIEIEGYNADTDYIENVINNEKLTPTNEDFAGMLTGLVNLAPYLFITLLMFFFIRLINKIWK